MRKGIGYYQASMIFFLGVGLGFVIGLCIGCTLAVIAGVFK